MNGKADKAKVQQSSDLAEQWLSISTTSMGRVQVADPDGDLQL